ncbi:MAG: phospholipase D family protein, partial [Hyphomicrobium sp.]|nr:phospholipase D family protein [Hyphomicrobium sp.]
MNLLCWLRWLMAAVAASQLVACASLPAPEPRPITLSLAASAATEFGAAVASEQPFPEASGFRLLRSGAAALEARIALIARAQRSVDLQYYHFDLGAAGLRIVEQLRAAARRQVRVRLLVDDLHTFGSDAALLELSREPNVEVRLFNPFVASRGPLASRILGSLWDFGRVNARMHNKLFVADAALAIVGGRNIADAYFDPAGGAAYLDLDVLVAGAVVGDLGRIFDAYWNNDIAYSIERIVRPASTVGAVGAIGEWPAPDPLQRTEQSSGAPGHDDRTVDQVPLGMSWGWAEAFA